MSITHFNVEKIGVMIIISFIWVSGQPTFAKVAQKEFHTLDFHCHFQFLPYFLFLAPYDIVACGDPLHEIYSQVYTT